MRTGICRCWRSSIFSCLGVLGGIFLCCAPVFAELEISNAWIKLAPPGARVNAAYMQLHNRSEQPMIIQKLTADCCAHSMLHRTYYENDQAKMEHLEQLVIGARQSVQLVPGGLHIMLMGAHSPLKLGDSIELQLAFSDGKQQRLSVPVLSEPVLSMEVSEHDH